MNAMDIDKMMAEKGNPCLSIIIPTIRYTREQMQNPELIEKAIVKARNLLSRGAWPKDKVLQLRARLNTLLERIDYVRLNEGLAIFMSPNILKIYLLPFTVKEKLILDKTFEIRDLIYYEQFLQPYYLLAVSKKRVRLFKGSGKDLQEVINNDFPQKYVEEYEYEHPSVASSSSPALKSAERDKSILAKTRLTSFFRQADHTLKNYVKDDMPLFIAGVEEEIVDYQRISHHVKHIAGKIPGNYDVDAVHPLAETVWKKIQDDTRRTSKEWLARLDDATGRNLAVTGIKHVWRCARQGNGHVLLLEKDYEERGYTKEDSDQLLLTIPDDAFEMIQDAADDLIEIVKEKGGEVFIVENGELENFGHIALILRYADAPGSHPIHQV